MQSFALAALAELLLARDDETAHRAALLCDAYRIGRQHALRQARRRAESELAEESRERLAAISRDLGRLDEELALPASFRPRSVEALLRERDPLRAEAALLMGESPGAWPGSDPDDLAALLERLDPGHRIVVFALHSTSLTTYVLSRVGVRVVRVDADPVEVDRQVATFRNGVASPRSVTDRSVRASMARSGQWLTQHLIRPAEEAGAIAPGQRLYVLIDDGLGWVPLSMLPTAGRSLVDSYEIALVPSLALRPRAPATGAARKALLVGGVDYRRQRYALGPGTRALAVLPGPDRELDFATAALVDGGVGVTTLRGGDATAERVLAALGVPDLDIAFITSHGRAGPSPDAPFARTELYLSAGGGDGRLTRAALASLPRAPRTVVLSACDTAAGETVPGEGLLGVAQAFLMAGAGSVIAAGQPVNDAAAVATMELLVAELASGSDSVTALTRAKRALGRRSVVLVPGERGIVGRVPPGERAPAPRLTAPGHHPYLRGAFEVVVGELPSP